MNEKVRESLVEIPRQFAVSLRGALDNNIFVRLWRLLGPFHRAFGLYVLLLLAYEGLQIFESYVPSLAVKLFVEKVEVPTWIWFFVGLLAFRWAFMIFDNHLDWHVVSRQGYPVFKYLKMAAVSKFLEMDMPWHNQHNSGALVGKVANGVGKVQETIDGFSWEFIPTFVQTILTLLTLIAISLATAVVSLVAFSIFIWLTILSVSERRHYKRERNDLYEEEWHRSVELVQTVETSLMFGQQERLLSEQEAIHDRIMTVGLVEAREGIFVWNRWRILFLSTARWLVLLFWVIQLSGGTVNVAGVVLSFGALDVSGFIFVSVMSEKLFASFWRFARLFDRLAEALEPVTRLETLLSQKSEMVDGEKDVNITGPVDVSIRSVNFAYSKEYDVTATVLHDLSMELPAGKVTALVGPSGGGKTTVRKILPRLADVSDGEVLVGGVDVRMWRQKDLRRLFSYVPQGEDVAVLSRSIGENIAFSKPEAKTSEVVAAAKLAGIHEFIAGLPGGYDTYVGERGKRLSGGQKQRVALARAILADAPILILDEATSAVDTLTESEIQEKLWPILANRTTLIIAHRLSTIRRADNIVVLDRGRIVEQGKHEELVATGGLYAKMLAIQAASVEPELP